MTIEKNAARARDSAAAAGQSEEAIRQAADDTICAMMLIRNYRVLGHIAAALDPMGLAKRDLPDDIKLEFHKIGRAHVRIPVTNAHMESRHILVKINLIHY